MRRPTGQQTAIAVVVLVVILGIGAAFASMAGQDESDGASIVGLESIEATDAQRSSSPEDTDTLSEEMASSDMSDSSVSGTQADASSPSQDSEGFESLIPSGADRTTRTGVTLVAVERVDVPENYDVVLFFAGWHTEYGMPVVEVLEAELLGEIDPITGEQKASPPSGASDHTSELIGSWLMAEPTREAAAELGVAGAYRVRLVLMPGEGAVVPHIDRAAWEN